MSHKFKVGDAIVYKNTSAIFIVQALGKYEEDGDNYYDIKQINKKSVLTEMHADIIEGGCELVPGYGTKLWEVLK